MRYRSTSLVMLPVVATLLLVSAMQHPAAQAPAGAQIPRTADGKPNLAGVWQVMNSAAWDIQDHHADAFPGLPNRFAMPGGRGVVEGNEIPYLPPAAAKKRS